MSVEAVSDDDDEWIIELSMDDPFNQEMAAFIENNPPRVVSAFFARQMRRWEFDKQINAIGALTRYRRKLVARSLVRMFRAGYRSGRLSASMEARHVR